LFPEQHGSNHEALHPPRLIYGLTVLCSDFFAVSSIAAVIASAQGEVLEMQAPGQRQYRERIAKYVSARPAPL